MDRVRFLAWVTAPPGESEDPVTKRPARKRSGPMRDSKRPYGDPSSIIPSACRRGTPSSADWPDRRSGLPREVGSSTCSASQSPLSCPSFSTLGASYDSPAGVSSGLCNCSAAELAFLQLCRDVALGQADPVHFLHILHAGKVRFPPGVCQATIAQPCSHLLSTKVRRDSRRGAPDSMMGWIFPITHAHPAEGLWPTVFLSLTTSRWSGR